MRIRLEERKSVLLIIAYVAMPASALALLQARRAAIFVDQRGIFTEAKGSVKFSHLLISSQAVTEIT